MSARRCGDLRVTFSDSVQHRAAAGQTAGDADAVTAGALGFVERRIGFVEQLFVPLQFASAEAGDADAVVEYSATQWARKYVGKNFDNGLLKKGEFADGPAQMQGMLMNLRKPMFQDPRVRHALTMAFDYDWMNRMMFYGQYRRTSSYFEASPFGATGMPGPKELALLEPLRASVPPEVFGPMLKQPDTIAPNSSSLSTVPSYT